MLQGIRVAGFTPAGDEVDTRRVGIPVRWSAIFGAIVLWNLLFALPFIGQPHGVSPAGWRVLLPLYAVLTLILAALKLERIARIIVKPGRSVGEIKPFLRLLAFICGLLAIVFSLIVLFNKGRFPGG